MDQVAARDLAVGDVARLDDPQAHRVERLMVVDGRVVLELRSILRRMRRIPDSGALSWDRRQQLQAVCWLSIGPSRTRVPTGSIRAVWPDADIDHHKPADSALDRRLDNGV